MKMNTSTMSPTLNGNMLIYNYGLFLMFKLKGLSTKIKVFIGFSKVDLVVNIKMATLSAKFVLKNA